MKTATLVRSNLTNFATAAYLYRLSEPLFDYRGKLSAVYVIVIAGAAVTGDHGPETYIFPSSSEGDVVSWSELPGSTTGTLDHEMALRNAGYEVE